MFAVLSIYLPIHTWTYKHTHFILKCMKEGCTRHPFISKCICMDFLKSKAFSPVIIFQSSKSGNYHAFNTIISSAGLIKSSLIVPLGLETSSRVRSWITLMPLVGMPLFFSFNVELFLSLFLSFTILTNLCYLVECPLIWVCLRFPHN